MTYDDLDALFTRTTTFERLLTNSQSLTKEYAALIQDISLEIANVTPYVILNDADDSILDRLRYLMARLNAAELSYNVIGAD